MKPEQLSAPSGSAPWMAPFVQSLIRVLQQIVSGREPKRLPLYADIAGAPDARDWQYAIAAVEDADGLGNPGLIWSDGTNWTVV